MTGGPGSPSRAGAANGAKAPARTVSVVLSSGGARGLAHIGVIQWLEENGFAIRSVAGASMGALVGGIYAAGKLPVYTEWVLAVRRADVVRLLDLSFNRTGLFRGKRIIDLLRDLIGDADIESLPISFTAVATDIENGKEVWLNRGPLFDAIRASIAIPTVFTPHVVGGRTLLDGGLINPLPIAPTLSDHTDLTIAVDLAGKADSYAKRPPAEPPDESSSPYRAAVRKFIEGLKPAPAPEKPADWGFFNVIERSFETLQGTITRMKLAIYMPDIIIEVPRSACGPFEFYRAAELIELGRSKAEAVLGPLRFNGLNQA